jgi:hypothetical protein
MILPQALNAMVLVKPATVVQWHRKGFRLYWRPQDGDLMPKSDEFKLQVGAASKAGREQRYESGNYRDHARHGTAVAQKSLAVLDTSEF